MNIEKIKVEELIPYINNARTHNKEQIKQIASSIKEFGFINPIIIDKDNGIIAGHGRLQGALKLKLEEVPCIRAEHLTEAQKKAYIIADNKLALNADWDNELLKIELEDLQSLDFDIDLLGFDANEINDLLNIEEEKEIIEDEVPETPIEAKSKLGQIYQLGNHRLMCGDSTSESDISKLMDGKIADMVFTDPPYGMNLDTDFSGMKSEIFKGKTGGKGYSKIIGDNEDFKPELTTTIFKNFNKCKEIFIWGADYFAEYILNKNNGSWIVWDKRANNNDNIQEDISSDKMYGSCFELCWSKNKHKRDIARIKWAGIFGMEKDDTKKRVHPTQKPIELIKWFLEKYSKKNELIIDIYGGSGSTLIACEQLDRKCYMMELDPKYVDVIIQRWENLTGEKAQLLEGE